MSERARRARHLFLHVTQRHAAFAMLAFAIFAVAAGRELVFIVAAANALEDGQPRGVR